MFNSELMNKFSELNTPFYFYDTDLLHKTLFAIKEAAKLYRYNVHYALKANSNKKILKIISSYGFGADCVSANEIDRALECGFPANKIVFAGVGKTDSEIKVAIQKDIFSINCESIEEIQVVNTIAGQFNKKVKIALRLNPNVDAQTHKNITTGLNSNKFGLSMNDLNYIIDNHKSYVHVKIDGIHFHIGSQITNLEVFSELCKRVNITKEYLTKRNFSINHINLGGGLGINYQMPENQIPDFQSYFNIFSRNLSKSASQSIHFEPGRSIIGQSGILITRVLYVKDTKKNKLIIVDAGFTDLIRPALYQAHHKIVNLSSGYNNELYDVAGPICETTDYFGHSMLLPETKRGDLMAVFSAGAYGESMSSRYNLRTPASSYFLDEILCLAVN